jgi:hypothetical protein
LKLSGGAGRKMGNFRATGYKKKRNPIKLLP